MFKIIVIGASLGGVQALTAIFSALPEKFPLPLAVVMHRDKESDDTLRSFLQKDSLLAVEEPEDKTVIMPGRIYLAPADYHLLIEEDHFALSTEAQVNHARPSIDVLFESAADASADNTIGVLLTGANRDGASGLAKIKMRGGHVIIQEPATAESDIMPKAGLEEVKADRILPPEKIGEYIVRIAGAGHVPAQIQWNV